MSGETSGAAMEGVGELGGSRRSQPALCRALRMIPDGLLGDVGGTYDP